MAGALVGGAFLSGFMNVVFDRFLSTESANFILGKKLDQQLVQRLRTALYAAEAVLADAEQKQFNNESVQKWLHDLRDAVYETDDLLDYVFTKAATQKEVSNISRSFVNSKDREMVEKMEVIVGKIENLEQRRYILGLEKISKENLSWRTQSTSLVGGYVYGREKDKEAIISMLLDDSTQSEISVIPIVGIGGIGKTTLAQLVYNDENIIKKFDKKAWVCISEEFDILKVTKSIIYAVTSKSFDMNDLNLLQDELKKQLSGKKFFIVLDDVWNIDYHGWNNLKKPFQFGAMGSKILFTTRSKKIASTFQTCPPYLLNELSEDHCWKVFAKHACFLESNGNSMLEKIGREIVKKCKGLPLAAETLGGLLRTKHDIKDWDTVLTSDIWKFSLEDSKIIPALLISYYHLPSHLKRCFAYCSLYPKDYRFQKDELIMLWMAEDLLVPSPKSGETLEVGYRCFDDLALRLFFKKYSTSLYDDSFVMHDLLHDLAMFVAGDFYFRLEELGTTDKICIHTRHLSYEGLSHPMSKNFAVFDQVKSLRTFLRIDLSNLPFGTKSATYIDTILSKLKYVRVLSFDDIDVLPETIGELIHLRYLDLSWTSIPTLPESLGDLYNLRTLKLCNCRKLTTLPNSMQNLVNLRHLDLRLTKLEEMPLGMNKLKHLQLLTDFVVGQHEENGIKELGELSNLHGSLKIRKLENVSRRGERLEAMIIKDKKHIDDLSLEWSSDSDMVTISTQIERDILEKLQPHTNVKQLTIKSFRGTRFPDWVGHSSYYNMTSVHLESCNNCCMLPSLGQLPSLKSLSIEDFNGLEIIGAEFYKNEDDHSSLATPFPSLEDLWFSHMPRWKEWHSSESNAFLHLKNLIIEDCPRLMGHLSNHLPALETLSIRRCELVVFSFLMAPVIRDVMISKCNRVELQELPLSFQSSSMESMTVSYQTCLRYLWLSDCSSAISFPGGYLPASLKELKIQHCKNLEFPKQNHELLESLEIVRSCDSLTSFPLEAFPNLKTLQIMECENLESLSFSLSQHDVLDNLDISDCPNFVSFPREGLPAPSMTRFSVLGCNKLKSLPCDMNTLLPKLESLEIENCPEIDSFPVGGLPPSLKYLDIKNSEKLLSNLSSMGVHEGLTDLYIYY